MLDTLNFNLLWCFGMGRRATADKIHYVSMCFVTWPAGRVEKNSNLRVFALIYGAMDTGRAELARCCMESLNFDYGVL